jgi:hypothetical protein
VGYALSSQQFISPSLSESTIVSRPTLGYDVHHRTAAFDARPALNARASVALAEPDVTKPLNRGANIGDCTVDGRCGESRSYDDTQYSNDRVQNGEGHRLSGRLAAEACHPLFGG